MAQLKDLIVNGASRFIGDIFGNKAQLTTLEAPISAGNSEYGPGTNGQVLKSNGSSLYWGTGGGGEYLTCSTAAGTAAKVITKDDFALTVGTSVFVVFNNTNTVNNPTLNINETGAKAIYYNGARVIYQGLAKDIIYHLVYDGTQWQVTNTIKPEIGICSTGASSAGKTATCPGFTLFNGAIAHIIFSNQNSHATPTLNINSTGAKAIYCVGATTKNEYRFGEDNHVYTLMYDGTKYNILQEDIRHYFSRGKSAVLYTQEEYDAYVAENGENPTWNVGDVKTAAVEGIEQIALGNYTTSNTDNGMTGRLMLCSGGTTYTRILAQSGYSKNFYLPKYNGDMYAVHAGNNNAIGTSTEPVYIAANGRATKGDKYAGGTAVTLNNASKAKTTASFYAPTAGGANNTQALVGAGTTTAPKWVNISTTLATSTAATASAGQKLKVTVLGQASSEVELSKATNALYGVTKLTDSYSSTDGTMATTGKALLAALQTLDVDAVGVAAATGNKFISQISETDGKISAEVSTATLGSTSLPVWVDGGVIKTITSYEGTAAKATAANIASTDNAIVRFDGAEGKFQNSGVTIDDDNNISTAGNITTKSLYVFGTQTANKTNRYITSDATNNIYFSINSKIPLVITDTAVRSGSSVAGTIDLGASGNKWNNVYANKYYGDGTNITLGTASYAVVTDANKKLSAVSLAVSDPSAEGQTTTFIDSISQDATGKISATKKNLDTSGTWSGTAAKATAANITTTANAVAYYTNTTGTFGYKASANGALYATAANGTLQWGTLPTGQGGTGNKTYTANRILYTNTATKFASGSIETDGSYLTIPGATTLNGQLILKSGVTYGDTPPTTNVATGQIFFTPSLNSSFLTTTDRIYMLGIKSAENPQMYYNESVYVQNNVLFGAAWNDYAEYRESSELEPGRVIIEVGNGRLIRSNERLQPGAEIVSDTYGFVIGKGNPRCATPVAIAGRVLAYPYEERLMFFAGDAVCSGPDGTVSKMTREEIKEYPDRIIGTVSEVPEYETWGENNIKVNGRIWIRLR